jgi:hypothetical protein
MRRNGSVIGATDCPTDEEVAQGYADAMDALHGAGRGNPYRQGRRYTRKVCLD